MRELKQSTAANVMVFMTDSADGRTGKTGLTLTITANKDGAAFASISPTVTERGNGWYSLALTTSHTDTLGDFCLHITGTGADASDLVCRVVANIESDTFGRIGAGGASLNTIPWNASWDAEVQSEATDALNAYDPPTKAELDSGLAALNDLSAAEVNAEVDTALADYDGPTNAELSTALAAADDAVLVAIAALNNASVAAIASAITSDHGSGSYVRNTEPPSAAAVASQVRTELATELARIDAAVTTRQATFTSSTGVTMPASPAAVGSAMTLTSGERDSIAAALLDLAAGVETGKTLRQSLRLMLAALVGKLSGAATSTVTIRDTGDSKNRIVATVDADGNRTAVTLDGT